MSGDRTPAADAADAADAAERADVVHEDRPFLGPPTRPHNEVQVKFDWIFFLNGLLGMMSITRRTRSLIETNIGKIGN